MNRDTRSTIDQTLRTAVETVETKVDAVDLKAEILNEHFHVYERWLGASPGQIGPGIQTTMLGFRVTSAGVANTFGAAIVVLDGTETPIQTGMLSFDPHRIQIVDVQNNDKLYRLRFANNSGGLGNYAAAVAAGDYIEIIFPVPRSVGGTPEVPTLEIRSVRVPSGTIIWAAIATSDAVAQWLDFTIGIHEYDDAA